MEGKRPYTQDRNTSYPNAKKPHGPPKHSKSQIDLILTSSQTVGVSMPYVLADPQKKQIIKAHKGRWNDTSKVWEVPMAEAEAVMKQLREQFPDIKVNAVAPIATRGIMDMPMRMNVFLNKKEVIATLDYSEEDRLMEPKKLPFYQGLYPFQRDAVKFGISRYGRVLIADQMGVGKTVESLALAYMYIKEWPLLIICPSSLKFAWKDQILHWCRDIKQYQVQVFQKTNSSIRDKTRVLIMSYQLAFRSIQTIAGKFKIAIADQAHYLKGLDTKRSLTVVPLLKSCHRVILLTGTPALAKPRQIFNILSIIRPDIYYKFTEFGERYCDPQKSPWSNAIQYQGSKNIAELHYILKDRFMIRRLKEDVLKDLPAKQRQRIYLETDIKLTKQINAILRQNQDLVEGISDTNPESNLNFLTCWAMTGLAKLEAVKEYIGDILESDIKILVFAHHRQVLDSIQSFVLSKNIQCIRIDGQTPPQQRYKLVTDFQNKPSIQVAVLSITAAGVGLTLTASSTVIFAQLHWTPAWMIQAQDRAHRIGQPSSVNCHYLIGESTLDDILYKKLDYKLNTVGQLIDGQSGKLKADIITKTEANRLLEEEKASKEGWKYEDKKDQGIRKFLKPKVEELQGHANVKSGSNTQQSDISESNHDSKNKNIIPASSDDEEELKLLKEDAKRRMMEAIAKEVLQESPKKGEDQQ